MARRQSRGDDDVAAAHIEPMRERVPRPPLAPPTDGLATVSGMTHEDLVVALRAVDGLEDVGWDPPNFLLKGRPFLHFHVGEGGTYADVRLGGGDFEPVRASTPNERLELLARVHEHVERVAGSRKANRRSED